MLDIDVMCRICSISEKTDLGACVAEERFGTLSLGLGYEAPRICKRAISRV